MLSLQKTLGENHDHPNINQHFCSTKETGLGHVREFPCTQIFIRNFSWALPTFLGHIFCFRNNFNNLKIKGHKKNQDVMATIIIIQEIINVFMMRL